MPGLKTGLPFLILFPLIGCADRMVGWPLEGPPTVDSTLPSWGATDVGLETVIVARFSEEMNPLTIDHDSFYVLHDTTPVEGEIVYEGLIATFTPDEPLLESTVYSVTVTDTAAAVTGLTLAADVGWSFTTGRILDETVPTVMSVSPEDEDEGVALGTSVSATFSETMHPLTIHYDSFILSDADGEIAGDVTQVGTTAWFNPQFDLEPGTEYTARITDEATDLAGNALAEDYVWTFTTGPEGTAPEVIDTDPADRDLDVDVTTNITATFSEAMDELTIDEDSFTVFGLLLAPVDGVVTYDPITMTATFDPVDDLDQDTQYVAMITTDATDLTGNPLAEDYNWSFTTGDRELFGPAPVDLGSLSTFVAVSGAGITNSAVTHLGGDVGISPASPCVGCAPPDMFILGDLYNGGSVAEAAKVDLTAALIEAMAYPPGTGVNLISADLHARVLVSGVYTSGSTMNLSTNGLLTLDAQGDPDAWWVFQVSSALTVQAGARVVLINGGRPANVFWAVGSSATLLENVQFQGTILAEQSLDLGTNASVNGRLLCTTGAISLLSNTVILPLP